MCWSATRRCWTIGRWRDLSRDGNPMLPLMDSSHWRPFVRPATTGIPRSVRHDCRRVICVRWMHLGIHGSGNKADIIEAGLHHC